MLFRTLVRTPALMFALGILTLAGAAHTAKRAHAQSAPSVVVMKNFDFSPMTLTVPAGTTVTWKNTDDEPHTVVSDAGLFRSGALDTNESFTFRFDKAGTYHYACSIHPRMVGTIVVE